MRKCPDTIWISNIHSINFDRLSKWAVTPRRRHVRPYIAASDDEHRSMV
jgi:hypothetical protein